MPNVHWKDGLIKYLLLGAALTSIFVVGLIFIFLGKEGLPFVLKSGVGALWNAHWMPESFVHPSYGIIALLTGSLLVTVIATVIAVPVGVCGAVYISEIAGRVERDTLKPFIELLAGIPSVVLGFFGLVVLAPIIRDLFHLQHGYTALTGALLLALMAIPTVMTISEDAIRSIPASYKQASLALGASKMQTIWKVTVPAALSGIVAATMLGVGRVVGETMVVLMVTGNAIRLTFHPLDPVQTLTATIAKDALEAASGGQFYRALFCIGIVLLLITFGLNVIARRVLKRYRVVGQ